MSDGTGNGDGGERDSGKTRMRPGGGDRIRPGGRTTSRKPVRTIVRDKTTERRGASAEVRPRDRTSSRRRDEDTRRYDPPPRRPETRRRSEPETRPLPPRRPRTELRPRDDAEGRAEPRPNRLLDEASSLLALGGFLLGADQPNDLERLRAEIRDAVTRYLRDIREDYDEETVAAAGFCICAFIDDCVLRTIWGQESDLWRKGTILAEVYGNAHRHELIGRIKNSLRGGTDKDLFALYHTVFRLGYVGMTGDEHDITRLKEEVYAEMRHAGHDEGLALVANGAIRAQETERFARRIPWWALSAGAAALLLVVFFLFRVLLQPSVEDFHAKLDEVGQRNEQLAPADFFPDAPPPEPPPRIDLRKLLLDADVAAADFELAEADPGTRILLRADGMFGSGSANLDEQFLPVLESIGDALSQTAGPIVVEGHTDNVPFSGGLRTNRSLSNERAQAVSNVLAGRLGGDERITARGRAARAPLVCNDSAENRRRNRRVELVLPGIETLGVERLAVPSCADAG